MNTVINESGKKNTYVRHRLAIILLITLVIAYVDRVNVSVLIVDRAFLETMGIADNPLARGSLMTVFLICYGLGSILLSPLGDRLGPKKTTLISIFLWSVALFFGGIAGSFFMMMLSRALLGIGESLHYPMQSKYVKNWFPVHERGKANATWLVGLNVGPMLAMPAFAWMIHEFGWRSNFFFLVALGMLPFFLTWKYTTDHPHQYKGISTEELNYIEKELAREKEKEKQNENIPEKISFWKSLFIVVSDYRVWLLVLAYSGTSSIYWGVITWLPAYLKEARGFTWAAMGALSALPYIMAILVKVIAGYAVDKTGRPAMFLSVGLFSSAVLIYLGAFTEGDIAATLLISFGVGTLAMGTPCAWVLLQQFVPGRVIGTGAGFMNGLASGISAVMPMMVGFFISLTGSFIGGLMYMVAWGVLGGVLSLILALKKY